MTDHARDLLRAGRLLLLRSEDRGQAPPDAAVRRSISTSYYALFHFILADCAERVVGDGDRLARRRNIFLRTISHRGLKMAMTKTSGSAPANDVIAFLTDPDLIGGAKVTPGFARDFAGTFLDAFQKRQQADYDLNVELRERDAIVLSVHAEIAMEAWAAADGPADHDFRHAFGLLIALQGKLRLDND